MRPAEPAERTGRAERTEITGAPALTVFYDGSCPLCRREIEVYRGLEPRTPLCFADVSDPALAPEALLGTAGRPREALLARFHVRTADGRLLDGAAAFLALWAALPGWRWLARVGRLPGAPWLLERLYRLFLRGRPRLQRWARRLEPPHPVRPVHPVHPADSASRDRAGPPSPTASETA